MSNPRGKLYIVATPLGNLGDMTTRAVEVLGSVDGIYAEDTHHSGPLLRHFGVTTPCQAMHDHNERDLSTSLVERLAEGARLAVISDAGTPLISDPGYILVREAHAAGIVVSPVPGPSSVTAALSVSGLPTDRFIFEGFLPAKGHARKQRLSALARETRTLVFFEGPHRFLEMLTDLAEVFGPEREATLARELTKMHETIHKSTLGQMCEWVAQDSNQQRGEIVLVVAGCAKITDESTAESERVLKVLVAELPIKQAAGLAAKLTGASKNVLYDLALQWRQELGDKD